VQDLFSKFRISDALMAIYKLFWDNFCAWYLEAIKPAYGEAIDRKTYDSTIVFFDKLLKMIHPFMPFITEELWQALQPRKEGETIMFQRYPEAGEYNQAFIEDFAVAQETVAGIRNVRQTKNLSPKDALNIVIDSTFPAAMLPVVIRLANVNVSNGEASGAAVSFVVGTSKVSVELAGHINVDEEVKKLTDELEHQRGFLASVRAKLSNEKFVAHAPEAVVAVERKKESDALERIAAIEESLKALK